MVVAAINYEHAIRFPENRRELANMLRGAAAAWRPLVKPTTPVWCCEHIRLPPETSANPGPFDLEDRPSMREPLAMLDDPDVLTITIMADAAKGKTTLISAMFLSRTELDPVPTLLCGPDQDSMRELRDKIYSIAEESPRLRNRIPPKRLRNDRYIDLQNMYGYLAFSGSRQRLRGRHVKYVFNTEVDVWQDDPKLGSSATLIKAHTKAWDEYKIVYESTPTDEASTIDAFYRAGDQRKYKVPCPHCGEYQELRFFPHKSGDRAGLGGVKGMQNVLGAWSTIEEARKNAYYECECCKGKIENHHRASILERGVWCPKGCMVNKRGHLEGTPDRPPRNVSYQDSALTQLSKSFGDVAAAYLEHRESGKLREFFNNWLGLKFVSVTKMPEWRTLANRLRWTHSRGFIPNDVWFTVVPVDVQTDRIYFQILGFGDAKTMTLIDWGCLRIDALAMSLDPEQNQTMARLSLRADMFTLRKRALEYAYPIIMGPNPRGLNALLPSVLLMDSGNKPREVHSFVRWVGQNKARAIKGDHKVDRQELFRMKVVERNTRTDEAYEGGMQVWGIATNPYREDLLEQYQRPPTEHGSLRLPANMLDHEDGEDFMRQVVNQTPVTISKNGRKDKVEWHTRDKVVGEHQWDNFVYGSGGDMVTGNNWDATTPWWQSQRQNPNIQKSSNSPRPSFDDQEVAAR